jgi:hypothetical protein
MGEGIIYDRALSTSEISQVNAYLTSKWLGFRTPTDIAGLQAWYDTTDDNYLTLDGSAITQFLDRSGNGNDTDVQGTASARPTRALSQINGLQAAVFDGVNDSISIPDDSTLQNIFDGGGTVFAVIRPESDGSSNFGRIIEKGYSWFTSDDNATNTDIKFAKFFTGDDGFWVSSGRPLSLGEGSICILEYDADSTTNDADMAINGSDLILTEDATPTGTRDSDVGSALFIGNRNAGDRAFDGAIAEVLIFNRALTSTEIDNIENYLSTKYNIGLA